MRINLYKTLLCDSDSDRNRIPMLVKEKEYLYDNVTFSSPRQIVKGVNELFNLSRRTEEFVYLLCMDTKLKPIGVFEVSHGTATVSCCSNREIFMKALLCGATNICVLHNHVSGECSPSKDDMKTCISIKEGGELMGIKLIDFIIVGEHFFSFKENELL